MAVQLGTVILDERLLLRGLFDSPQVSIQQKLTLAGTRRFLSFPVRGRSLSLTTEGPNGVKYGLFTRTQLDELAALRDQGDPITLVHGLDQFTVVLMPDSIQVTSVIETSSKNSGDLFTGSITLQEI